MIEFNELKQELLDKAKKAGACTDQYKRAYKAETEAELLEVINDNLNWCADNECVSHEYFSKFNQQTYLKSGIANTGKENTGFRNSGNSNSGYRNSGAFCTDPNPCIWLFDKPTNIPVRDWERSRPYQIMAERLNFNIWVWSSEMSEEEKKNHPSHETTGGYLKSTPYKEGWINMWGNLTDKDKSEFTSLPNFDKDKFFEITGIQI